MNEEFITETDLEYTNSLMDENRDVLFSLSNYREINTEMTELNDRIEQIPEEYKELFSDYDHLFHKAYEYEICMMFFIGLRKGLSFKEKN